MKVKRKKSIVLLLCSVLTITACGQKPAQNTGGTGSDGTPTPTPVSDVSVTPEATPAPVNSSTPEPTQEVEATDMTPEPTLTPEPEVSLTPTVEAEPSPAPTQTPAPVPTEAQTVLVTPKPTATNTPTPTISEVPLDAGHFPDAAFRQYVSAYVDKDGNGTLSQKELDAVTDIRYGESLASGIDGQPKITWDAVSLVGIEYFQNLQTLHISSNLVETMHLNHSKLKKLNVSGVCLKDFSVKNAENLTEFCLLTNQDIVSDAEWDIDWSSMRNLTKLRISNSVLENAQNIDFSLMKELKEVEITGTMAETDEFLVETFDFGHNEKLESVCYSEGLTKQLILPNRGTFYKEYKVNGKRAEVIFQDELDWVAPENLPEGSIVLDAEHFPDAAFRQYLYLYADTNRDKVLSQEERESVTRIRNDHWDYDKDDAWNEANIDTEPDIEELDKFYYAGNIQSLQGIEYFPNLYEIQLKGITFADEVTELFISNPKIEILEVNYKPGNVRAIHINCPELRYCILSCSEYKNTHSLILEGKTNKDVTELYLDEAGSLQTLRLYQVCIGSWEELGNCKNLKSAELAECSLTDEQAAYLKQLTGLEYLELWLWNDTVLDELNLSQNESLKTVWLCGAFQVKKMILPDASVKAACTYYTMDENGVIQRGDGTDPEIVYE